MTATTPRSCIVHGPAGCGKSTNAQAIAKALGLRHIHDNWTSGTPVPLLDTLVLTSADDPAWYFNGRVLSFDQAMQLVAHEKDRDRSESNAEHHVAAWLGQTGLYRTRLEAVQNGEQLVGPVSADELFELARKHVFEAGIHA
ncbi:hypothetical protein [Pseudomonas juntendi]|uniref:hypothetical protein n=1 Tax=Pseudomonas juntendi TaxID=2666183 RepID=UPI002447ACDE|nr:hypothetical protein [Pseudomonas juntendi]MDG9890391.1 hypothetical protein [Pseudomonas juntendi]MDH0045085.1 hypothetical protein [Pseudomonas juntendi]